MSGILTDLYYGRIAPAQRLPIRNEESRELERRIELEKRYFEEKMSPDDRRRLDDLEDLYS